MEGIILKGTDFTIVDKAVIIDKKLTKGKPGMLLIWATWCGHCVKFKPTFNQLCRLLGDSFPCTSVEDTELKLNKDLTEALSFKGYPSIKYFDQSGKIIGDYTAIDRSKESILNNICDVYHHCIENH